MQGPKIKGHFRYFIDGSESVVTVLMYTFKIILFIIFEIYLNYMYVKDSFVLNEEFQICEPYA